MIGSILSFLAFYVLHIPHTLVALAIGVVLHIPLKAAFLKIVAKVKGAAASAAAKV